MLFVVIVILVIAAAGGFLGSLLEFAGGIILMMALIGAFLGMVGVLGVRRRLDARRR